MAHIWPLVQFCFVLGFHLPKSEPRSSRALDVETTVCLQIKQLYGFIVQMTKNPFTSQLLNASELLRGLSPAMVRQVLPLLDQLTPIYTDLADGRLEFVPEPEETKRLIRTFYGERTELERLHMLQRYAIAGIGVE